MSCLFASLIRFTGETNPEKLRNEICDFLQKNTNLTEDLKSEQVIEYESDKTLDDYVKIMRRPTTMGGATEIRAFCLLYNRNVTVKSLPNRKNIEFICNSNDDSTIHLIWNGGHYEAPMDGQN